MKKTTFLKFNFAVCNGSRCIKDDVKYFPYMTEREFKKLYNLYFRPLCLYALHYVSDASVSEDIVQDSFVVFWEKYVVIDNDMNGAAAKSVLFVIVRNRCTDWLRKVSPDRLLPEDADGLITDVDAQERSFDEAALWSIIGRLPEKRRKILIMNKRDGLSYKEIAEELRVSVLTVRNHLALAMKELRRAKPVIQVILTLLMMLFPLIPYPDNVNGGNGFVGALSVNDFEMELPYIEDVYNHYHNL